ncbi:hypothetical protein J6590_066657 [Homalodisca vitripennis]|nr:hypothetical protein J6590_066657 [Homalodisca vitripennis]
MIFEPPPTAGTGLRRESYYFLKRESWLKIIKIRDFDMEGRGPRQAYTDLTFLNINDE